MGGRGGCGEGGGVCPGGKPTSVDADKLPLRFFAEILGRFVAGKPRSRPHARRPPCVYLCCVSGRCAPSHAREPFAHTHTCSLARARTGEKQNKI